MVEIMLKALLGVLAAVTGYLLREISKVKEKIEQRPTYEEMDNYVDLKLEVHKHVNKDVKEDIQRIETKLDKLIEMQIKGKD